MKNDTLTDILGYEPNAELKRMILTNVKITGRSVEDCASDFAMPEQFIADPDGTFLYKGQRYDKETFAAQHPYRKFIIIY